MLQYLFATIDKCYAESKAGALKIAQSSIHFVHRFDAVICMPRRYVLGRVRTTTERLQIKWVSIPSLSTAHYAPVISPIPSQLFVRRT
jgi:hypothetical protein